MFWISSQAERRRRAALLYYLSFLLASSYSGFNVFRYITFRAAMAALLALMISFLLGPWLIRVLTEKQIGQQIRDDGPASHCDKAGTPTMGGALILLALLISTLMLADIGNRYVLLALIATVGSGVVGFTDDYLKLTRKNSKGLSPRAKLLGQLLVAFIVAVALYNLPKFSTEIAFPFIKTLRVDLDIFYIPFAMLVIIGSSNAVNLTDGLDGFAIGPVMVGGGRLRDYRLCHRPLEIRRIFADSLRRRGRRIERLLRRGDGRRFGISLVQRLSRADVHGRRRLAFLGRGARRGRGDDQERDSLDHHRRRLCHRSAVGDLSGGIVQASPQAGFFDGADSSSL